VENAGGNACPQVLVGEQNTKVLISRLWEEGRKRVLATVAGPVVSVGAILWRIGATQCDNQGTFVAEISLESLLEAQRADYDANFSHIEHEIACDEPPSATIRLHFVRCDASGEPRFRELARLLARYITLYCVRAERRKDLPELERNEMFMQCRDLFTPAKKSGQVGELLIYFLLETVLHAPQALKKMPMTTNPNEERKGSDGVHLLWNEQASVLELIFAESKIWKSFSGALADAFKSIESFHDSRTKQYEVNAFTSGFSNLNPELQEQVLSFISSTVRLEALRGDEWLSIIYPLYW
jgi:hypothetical protein